MNTGCKFHYKSEHYFASFPRDNSQETVFTDGFENIANWDRSENSFGHSISALDSSKKRSGAYSGRIDDNYPTNGEKYVYSDTWTSITNSNDTFYTVAAWVYVENVADNSAEIYLATRKAGETGYPSGHYVSDRITQKGQWVYVEKSISVPADVRQLNVRIDNNKDGKVWFDDVTIVKGNTSKTLIVEESNYYPFGLKHKGYNNVTSSSGNSTAQKFKYNGIELEESLGLNLYEMELRLYDPAIARWNGIDIVDHYDYSPYQAFDNNPIFFADPSGADASGADGLTNNQWLQLSRPSGGGHDAMRAQARQNFQNEVAAGKKISVGEGSFEFGKGNFTSFIYEINNILDRYIEAMNSIWRAKAYNKAVQLFGNKKLLSQTESDISIDITDIVSDVKDAYMNYGVLSGDFYATFELDDEMKYKYGSNKGYKQLGGSVQVLMSRSMPNQLKLRGWDGQLNNRNKINNIDYGMNSSVISNYPWAIHYVGGTMSFKTKKGRDNYLDYWENIKVEENINFLKEIYKKR